MSIHERLAYLVHRVADQSVTAEELQELSELVLEDSTGELSSRIELLLQVPAATSSYDIHHWDKMADKILQADRHPKVFRMRKWSWAAAAAVLLLLSFGSYFFMQQQNSTKTPVLSHQPNFDIAPGGNKAMLTLGDGTQISLDSAANGILARQGNTQVIKSSGGQLVYEAPDGEGALLYNKIATPRGGQYQLTLPDSTHVWLNASSTLRFPAAFKGHTRTVQLTGEAYFEVAKNASMPFIVQVEKMEVKVLGTHFNIMAYDDETVIKTTLLEGAVRVNDQQLIPGQGAHLNRNTGTLEVLKDVNTEEAVAWKNGFIQFEGNDLPSVMRQIARWYDVEVVYKGNVAAHFRGAVPRNVPVSQVLKMMELTGEVHFEINEQRIIVSP